MPRCFVERCHNYGGKRLNIILHSFPNNLDKIKTWLRCIEGSGHVIRDIEELAERIFEGKTNNRFRVCSEHFTEQSYQPSGLRKTLRKDAVPTIFRDVPPQKCPWQKVKPTLKSTSVAMSALGQPNCLSVTSQQPNRAVNPSALDQRPCGRANMATIIKAPEYFQHNAKESQEGCRLGTRRSDVTHVILKLTLEIICLLTGEDYIVVKKTCSHGEGWSRTPSPIVEPPPDFTKNNQLKILDLTQKIMELLRAETCDYVEDDQVGMDSQQALSSLDEMVNGLGESSSEEKEETDGRPILHSNIKVEAVSYDGRNIPEPVTCISVDTQHYPSPPIKEEPVSSDQGPQTDSELPTDHTHASPHIKEELASCEQYDPSLIKEEPLTYDGGHLVESNLYTPTHCIERYSPANMEEPTSSDGGNHTSPTEQPPSDHSIAEPGLCNDGRAINTAMYTEAQQSSSEDVHNNYSFFDKGSLDTDIYALIKHAQAKYTFTRIKDGSSSEEEEENSKDTEPHTEHAPLRPAHATAEAVPQTFQCPDCSECFTRKSGLINHRRNHRQEKLTCSKCGKVFSKRSSLQNHLTLHTGEKPYACPVCGKCFARKSNLISHETIHSGKASFICAECGRFFVCKVHLTKHQIIHEK
ncbi:uncharacterized protein RB166_021233 [Leptodactylus fuscus]|uniref:uncharacterized protein LOC142187367 n=1 Tax=Leptodactylus fuscus TaxID=238119 RepID=UPI003F4EA047